MAVDPTAVASAETDELSGPSAISSTPPEKTGDAQKVEVPEARKANVKKMLDAVKAAKKHWGGAFKRMRDDIYFAEGNHWEDAMPGVDDGRIVVDITTRHIQLRTAALYAKNPTAVARRRDTMDFLVWDEKPETLVAAQATMQAVQAEPGAAAAIQQDPNLAAQVSEAAILIDDVAKGLQLRAAMTKLARTLEINFKYQMGQQNPPLKGQMKDLIPRVLTTNVGWIKLDYQRQTGRKPGQENRLSDMRDQLATLQTKLKEWKSDEDGSYDDSRAAYDQLQIEMEAVQNEPEIVLKEGLLFQFPRSWAIIPDKKCKSLFGFAGCDWAAEEMEMSCEDIADTFNVDLKGKYTGYVKQYDGQIVEARGKDASETYACVYTIYNRRTGLVYVVCDGYEDFLKEPAQPDVQFSHFFPWFVISFNRTESASNPYAKSDVRLLAPLQRELNRNAESKRNHRIANQPKYMHDASFFEEDEKLSVMDTPPHESIPVKQLRDGVKLTDVIQPIPKVPMDPIAYTAEDIYESIMRVIGTQEANLGQPKQGDRTSATAASIAEASRMSSQESNKDDLDDLLTLVAKNGGEILLQQMSEETVKQIAGRGATWVNLTRAQAADELYLETEVGSSGRPNQAQEIAVREKIYPLAMQVPGLAPSKMLDDLLTTMSPNIKLSDWIDPRITQSIMQMNRGGAQPMGGPPQDNPDNQGPEGSQNAPQTPQGQPAPDAQVAA